MATETVFQYRHKKFDQNKRTRENNSIPLENKSISNSVSIRWVSVPSSLKPKPVTKNKLTIEATARNEPPAQMESINLKASTPPPFIENTNPELNPPKRRQLQFKGKTDEIQIKLESIESAENLHRSPTRDQVSYPIKTEDIHMSEDKYAVKIKQELIELNTNVPKIPKEAYEDICKFRGNMVRKFPKKERSIKEQERRDKNTFACRRSRRVKKIEQVAVEEEYKGYKDTHLRLAEYAIRAAAYFKELVKRTDEAMSEIIVVD